MSDQTKPAPGRDPVVIEPRASRLDPEVHDPVIFCPVGPLVPAAARIYGAKKKLKTLEPARVYAFKAAGRRMSLVGPAMGAPAATYVLERLIANGVKNVVMVGLAGSTHQRVKIGQLVVPEKSWIDEGTSGHYEPGTRFSAASPRALEALQEAARESGRSFHTGPIWTIDAEFRETKEKVMKFGQRGCLAVEMETSALFTVAAYRGIDLASILVISDELYDLTWRQGFTRPKFLASCRHALRIARAAALKMAGVEEAPPAEPEPEEPESDEPEPEEAQITPPDQDENTEEDGD